MEFGKIIGFLKEIEKFKACERTCKTTKPDCAESDAEHSEQTTAEAKIVKAADKGYFADDV